MNISGLIFITIGLYFFSELNNKIVGLLIIAIGLHTITYEYKLKSLHNQEQMTNWEIEQSLKLHSYFKKYFGNPWISINRKNGFAIWMKNNKQNIYDKIIIKDSLVQFTMNNINYEYSLHLYIQIYIPNNMLNNILNKYKTASYSRHNYMLYIISDNIKTGHNVLKSILKDIHKNNYNNKNISLNELINLNKTSFKMNMESNQIV